MKSFNPSQLCVAMTSDGSFVELSKSGSFAQEALVMRDGGTLQTAAVRTRNEWHRLFQLNKVHPTTLPLLPVEVIRTVRIISEEQP